MKPQAYGGLIPEASMIRASLSLSLGTKRANSGCVMLIGSAPCSASESRRSGAAGMGARR